MKNIEKEVKDYWHKLGPGLTTGASDDDPSGIATYSQAGAKYGFQLMWLSVITFPLMSVVQEMCARIGIVTGQGLAANIRKYFPRRLLYICTTLLLLANIFNIGADLGAMASAVKLLLPNFPFWLAVIFFGLLSIILEVFIVYREYAKYLKYLALVLFAYVFSALLIHMDWSQVFYHTFVPHIVFSKEQILLICGILGTTISPYLFFWQTSQEVEEEIVAGQDTVEKRVSFTNDKEIKDMRVDVWSGMFISNVVMFFIIATCGAVLHASGITNITTAADAARALHPIAGDFSYALFAIGIIGTGMLAIPVLAGSAAYAVAESFRFKEGLYLKLKDAYAFYAVIAIAILVGIILNFVGLDPIKALLYSAVGNGLVSPVVLYFIVKIASSKKIMGERANKRSTNYIGWLTVGLMTVSALAVIVQFFV